VPFSRYLTLNNIVTLKSGLEVTRCHWSWWSTVPLHCLSDEDNNAHSSDLESGRKCPTSLMLESCNSQ